MKKKISEFQTISNQLFNSVTASEEFISASLLYEYCNDNWGKNKNTEDTYLDYGIALSLQYAADCIKDYKRTARFCKGIYRAITSLTAKFPNRKINILYAGCGPYAPLILTLLHRFTSAQINIVLIDINQDSINTVKKVISDLNYTSYFSTIRVEDATKYTHKSSDLLDLIITETMFKALTREPQVAITQNLAPQLAKDGILIPNEIKISLGYSSISEEPYMKQSKDEYVVKKSSNTTYNRAQMTTLFVLNKREKKRQEQSNPYHFESIWYTIPKEFKKTPDICLYTTVKIFDGIQLNNEDSLITNPHCIESLYNFHFQTKFRLKYTIRGIPKWDICKK